MLCEMLILCVLAVDQQSSEGSEAVVCPAIYMCGRP